MAVPYEKLKALAAQKRAEYGVVTKDLGLQRIRSIYKAEGITLDYRTMSPKIRAIYMCDDDEPSVAVNNRLPPEPKLFSLAHEWKHHLEDRPAILGGMVKCGDYNANQEMEIGAEVFAAEFIYPEAEFLSFAEILGLARFNTTAAQIVEFKRGCGAPVSFMFIRKRLERLGFIAKGQFADVQFQNLEEKLFGLPIYKQPGFQAKRALRKLMNR